MKKRWYKSIETLCRVTLALALTGFIILTIVSITIPSLFLNLKRVNPSEWRELPAGHKYACYTGLLKAEFTSLGEGANKPLILVQHQLSWIPLLEISAWASNLLFGYANGTSYSRNLFYAHHMHVLPGKELQIAYVSPEGEYIFSQGVMCIEGKITNRYWLSFLQEKNLSLIEFSLTNWRWYLDAVYVEGMGWLKNFYGELGVKTNGEYRLSTPYLVDRAFPCIEIGDVSFLVMIKFNKPITLSIVADRKGIRTLEFRSGSLTDVFEQQTTVRVFYRKRCLEIKHTELLKAFQDAFY